MWMGVCVCVRVDVTCAACSLTSVARRSVRSGRDVVRTYRKNMCPFRIRYTCCDFIAHTGHVIVAF